MRRALQRIFTILIAAMIGINTILPNQAADLAAFAAEKDEQKDLTLTEQKIDAVVLSEDKEEKNDNVKITISGKLPENAVAEAYPVEVKIPDQKVITAYDITILVPETAGQRETAEETKDNTKEETTENNESAEIEDEAEEDEEDTDESILDADEAEEEITEEENSDNKENEANRAEDPEEIYYTVWQPEEPLKVTISDEKIKKADKEDTELLIYHLEDEKAEPEYITDTEANKGKVSFEAESFSVYAVVAAPEAIPDGNTVQDTTMIRESKGVRLSISTTANTYYAKSETNTKMSGFTLISRTTNIDEGAVWYFQPADEDGQYYIYFLDSNNEKNYIHVDQVWNTKFSFSKTNKTVFTVEDFKNSPGYFYIYVTSNNKKYAFNLKRDDNGTGFQLYESTNNGAAGNKVLMTYAEEIAIPDDAYELDGKTYGFVNHHEAGSSFAMIAEQKTAGTRQLLTARAAMKRTDPFNAEGKLYETPDEDITMWTFHNVSGNVYTLTTEVDGNTVYMKSSGTSLTLTETPDAECEFTVQPGVGSFEGRIRLIGQENAVCYSANNDGFGSYTPSASNEDQWLDLTEPSAYNDDDFVSYAARKVSVSEVQNGDNVIIYTRVWNSETTEYEFYLVDYNGQLVRAYESGDDIVWVGTKINTTPWEFKEYYYAGTTDPNYYYDLKNVYSDKYCAPQITGSKVLSDDPMGINLVGRRYDEYYTQILAWDDPHYDYVGWKAENGRIVTAPMSQADTFYFAKIEAPEELHTVSTVDHSALGLTMRLVDFDGKNKQNTFLNDSTPTHGTKSYPGLLQSKLGSDSYPLNKNGNSMASLFADGQEVNHLFLNSTYEGSGYYEFDSTKNFASLTDERDANGNRKFKVYQELGTIDITKDKTTLDHSQFMPYNDLKAGEFAELHPTNERDALNNVLDDNDPRKGEKLYKIPSDQSNDPNKANYYFGMEISGNFLMPPSGHDAWGHDIIFEFTGDDDFWLYVDGELVLDLGGVHSAIPGSVNYSTGKVVVRGADGKDIKTTLYDIFKANYQKREPGASAAEVNAYLDGIFTDKDGNKVFKDYSTHSIRIFFMERGAGASNLWMRFNLAAVTPGRFLLSKEVTGTDKQDYASARFPFQIRYIDEDGTEKVLSKCTPGASVTYLTGGGEVEYMPTYTSNGVTYEDVFMLKPGQTAVVKVPDNARSYKVTECAVKTHIYSMATINNEIPAETETHIGSPETKDYTSTSAGISERAQIVFNNYVDPANLRTLTVTKKLFDENDNELTRAQDETGFKFRMFIGGENEGDEEYYSFGEYFVKDEAGHYCTFDVDGGFQPTSHTSLEGLTEEQLKALTFRTSMSGAIDKIPAGYSFEINDLLVGTRFKVIEESFDLPLGYGMREWTEAGTEYVGYKCVEGSFTRDNDSQNSGAIRDNNDAKIYVMNQRGYGIRADKVWSDADFIRSHGDIFFAVFVGNSGTPVDGTIRRIDSYNYTSWYFQKLQRGADLSDYHVYEVELTNPVIGSNNEIGYDSIRKIGAADPDEEFTVSGNTKMDGTDAGDLDYRVEYTQGTSEKSDEHLDHANVRKDTVRNIRTGGLTIVKEDMNGGALAGAEFTLMKSNKEIGTYTSAEDGIATTLYLENGVYTLTETKSPSQYQAVMKPVTIKVNAKKYTVSGEAVDDGYAVYDAASGSLTIKNRPLTLAVKKVDSVKDTPVAGAHFALYREYNGVKEYRPIEGFDDMVTDNNGMLAEITSALKPGTYYLTETTVPEGYDAESPVKDVRFTISASGIVTIDDDEQYTGVLEESADDDSVDYLIKVSNKSTDGPLVAPTNVVTQFAPYILVLVAAIAIVVLLLLKKHYSVD